VTPEQLSTAVRDVLAAAVDAGEVALPNGVPGDLTVERPRNREHGDYATNVALQLAKRAGANPRALAELLAARLRLIDGVEQVDVAGPGFLNITVSAAAQGELARVIVEAGRRYGRGEALAGLKVNIEFISANPTGPLHLGHVRWAAVGDAIARVLDAAGAQVTREFYINDRGTQMDLFGASIMARAHGTEVPPDGYHGSYVSDLAKAIVDEHPEFLDLPDGEQRVAFREEGYRLQLAEQQRQLDAFRTHFDVWTSERSLHASGKVEHGIDVLRSKGSVFESDGAVWMRTTDFGDDKDRVLVRRDGSFTYFASDTAYYVDKRERGFDVVGGVGREDAVVQASGHNADPRRGRRCCRR